MNPWRRSTFQRIGVQLGLGEVGAREVEHLAPREPSGKKASPLRLVVVLVLEDVDQLERLAERALVPEERPTRPRAPAWERREERATSGALRRCQRRCSNSVAGPGRIVRGAPSRRRLRREGRHAILRRCEWHARGRWARRSGTELVHGREDLRDRADEPQVPFSARDWAPREPSPSTKRPRARLPRCRARASTSHQVPSAAMALLARPGARVLERVGDAERERIR